MPRVTLTRRGFTAIGGSVILAALGGVTGDLELVLVAVALVVLLVGGTIQAALRARRSSGLTITAEAPTTVAAVGTPLDLTLVISGADAALAVEDPARCWRPVAAPGDATNAHATGPEPEARPGPVAASALALPRSRTGRPLSVSRPAPTGSRGLFALRGPRFWAGDTFGLVVIEVGRGPSATLTVHPVPTPVAIDPSLLVGRAGSEESSAPARVTGPRDSSGELAGVRPYQPGDRLRLLHWPSMARTGELMVRDFEAVGPGTVALVADTRVTAHGPDGVERTVAATAGVGLQILAQGSVVEIWTLTGEHRRIEPGPGGPQALLCALATVAVGDQPGPPPWPGTDGRRRNWRRSRQDPVPSAPAVSTGVPPGGDIALTVSTELGAASLPASLLRTPLVLAP